MSRKISKLFPASILISLLALLGCSSDDDPVAPPSAVTITDANAVQVVTDAIVTGNQLLDLLEQATAVEIGRTLTPRDIINLVLDKTRNISGTSALSTPTGVIIPDTCTSGGDVIIDITSTATTESGSVTLINCIESGITLNGVVSFNSTNDVPSIDDFSDTLTGNITGTDGVDTVAITGLNFNETGNDGTGAFSINTYTYTAAITGDEGFSSKLLAPIVGNNMNTCPDDGSILVSGAAGTQGRGTIVPGVSIDNDIKVEFNDGSGTFVEATGSPVPCVTVF